MKPRSSDPAVTAVILNYNRAEDTIACVESLKKCTYDMLSLLVVDNCSTDGSFRMLKEHLPEIEIVQTDSNLGFAGGNNFGIRHALKNRPQYILVINNDTIVTADFLGVLVSAIAADERAAIACGTICYYPDTNKIWYAGGSFVPWRASSFSNNLGEDISKIQETAPLGVTFITGCMMLIKSEALLSAGMFDERFFMYSEDSELSLRYIEKGYRLLYVPKSVIYHKIHHHGDTPFTIYYGVRNRLLLIQIVLRGLKKILAYSYLYTVFFLKGIYWMFGRRQMAEAVTTGISDFWMKNFSQGSGPVFQITRTSKTS